MKNRYLYHFLTLFLFATTVSASDISYTIINTTAENKISVAVSTITKRTTYDCELASFTCQKITEKENVRIDDPLKEVTVAFLDERDMNASTTSKAPYIYPTKDPVIVFDKYELPRNARFIASSSISNRVAYFESDGTDIKTFKRFVVIDKDGKSLERFDSSRSWELLTDTPRLFGFTDDGNKLVYMDDRGGSNQLYLVDFQKNPKNLIGEQLINKPYTVLDFVVKGDKVYFIANREGVYKWGLYSLDLNSRKLDQISSDVMYTNDLVFVGDNLIFTINENGAGVLKAFSLVDSQIKSFSGIEDQKVSTSSYKVISTKNLSGIVLSPQSKATKAVIWLHGGPYRQTSVQRHPYGSYATYDWILDELVSSGVEVFKIDYPGSMGKGIEFSQSIVKNIGVKDVSSLSHAVNYLKNKGIKNIYLFGNSYGGYLSLKGLAELNNSLSGAIAVAPVTDWQKLIRDVSPTPFEVHFGGVPNDQNQKIYDKASIVGSFSKLKKPAILFHGDLDRQVPFSQSEFLLREAVKQNKDIKYYAIKNQAHIISGVTQNEAICQKAFEFMGISTSTDSCKMQ